MADNQEVPSSQEPDTSQLLSKVHQLIGEITAIKTQAEAHLKQSEIASKTADSEALLAFNAKKACEEHATTIAGVKGVVEADANAIATNKQRSDEALAALTTAKAVVDGDIKAIGDQRKEIDQTANNVSQAANTVGKAAEAASSRLKEIEASKESAENEYRDAAQSAKTAVLAASDAASARNRADEALTEATTSATKASEQHTVTTEIVAQVQALLEQAQTAQEKLKIVLDHLAHSDEIATGHEKRVAELKEELQNLIKSVEGLLPGATSAGLASSFNKQRSRFTSPQKQWLWTFVICIGALVVLALPSFLAAIGLNWSHHPMDDSWNAAWRNLVLRLPIVFPVVWLAIYAGRNYMMSLRMEEDYAYKEAISTAFEGYKREMEKIARDESENPTPITILCTNILRAIAERPGRIYEGKPQDINLATEVQTLVEKSAELSKKKVASH